MILKPPYLVLVTACSAGVGQSTLASNLAVYLKGLDEDLPVAYVSCDLPASEAMFALPGSNPGELSGLQQGARFDSLLELGEFGVQFCSLGAVAEGQPPCWLRKELAQADFDGVLILDLTSGHPLLPAALWAADLVLAPVKDPAMLGDLVALRREFLSGGGSASQFWLVPSELGGESRYRGAAAKRDDLLRFAAEERNFRLFGETFAADLQVRVEAAEKAKPVLTRVPQSLLHQFLHRLAEQVLAERRQPASLTCRVSRWQADAQLPERAGRVALRCPHCQQPVLEGEVHYLESLPARRRLLLHRDCAEKLLKPTGAVAFLATSGFLLLQPAVARGSSSEELFLQVLSPELDLLNTEQLLVNESWQQLLRCVTGRHFSELYWDWLLISPPVSAEEALSVDWYRQFVQLRRRLRTACREEKI